MYPVVRVLVISAVTALLSACGIANVTQKTATEAATAHYCLSPPKGFRASTVADSIKLTAPDGKAELYVNIDEPPNRSKSLESFLSEVGIAWNCDPWHSGTITNENIGDITFERAEWSCCSAKGSRRGILYSGTDAGNLIMIRAQQYEPFDDAVIDVMEQSIKTFRRP